MAVFALGWKGWVELRRARSAPQAECSEVIHQLDPSTIPYWQRRKSVTLKQLCFRGGTFLLSLPRRRFAALTRLRCPQGSVVALPPSVGVALLKKVNYEHAPHRATSET